MAVASRYGYRAGYTALFVSLALGFGLYSPVLAESKQTGKSEKTNDRLVKTSNPAGQGKMLVLKCNGELYGPSMIKFSDLGFSIRTRIGGLLWLKSRPNVYTQINPENKTYLENTPQEYFDDLRDEYPTIVPDRVESKPGEAIKGKPTKHLTIYRKERDGKETVCAEVTTVKRDIVDAQTCKAWCYLFTYLPADGSLPVAVKQGRRRGRHAFDQIRDNLTDQRRAKRRQREGANRMLEMLTTSEVTVEPFDASSFALPKGLNKAKDRASLYLSVDGDIKKGDIEDLFMRELK